MEGERGGGGQRSIITYKRPHASVSPRPPVVYVPAPGGSGQPCPPTGICMHDIMCVHD